jgi:hypothetical protein
VPPTGYKSNKWALWIPIPFSGLGAFTVCELSAGFQLYQRCR